MVIFSDDPLLVYCWRINAGCWGCLSCATMSHEPAGIPNVPHATECICLEVVICLVRCGEAGAHHCGGPVCVLFDTSKLVRGFRLPAHKQNLPRRWTCIAAAYSLVPDLEGLSGYILAS